MKPLYAEAIAALRGFDRWQIRTVPRAQNARADAPGQSGARRPVSARHSVPAGSITPRPGGVPATLWGVTDALIELSARLEDTAQRLRAGELDPDATLALIEECARLASEASAQVDERVRAALEPLPDLPGQLPLPAA